MKGPVGPLEYSQRQEILYFHQRLKPLLEKVLALSNNSPKAYYTLKKPCKRLMQKCSFKSLMDAEALCSLLYWLYIYGEGVLALELCDLARSVEFVQDPCWPCSYPAIYGLEIRIAREQLGENRRHNIPPRLLKYYFSKQVQKRLRYPQVLGEEQIQSCSGRRLELELLQALYRMIGCGETGLYSGLNENWDRVEETICLYLDCLKLEG